MLCEVLKVSRSGHYARTCRPPSPSAWRRDRLATAIGEVHGASRATYGLPRVHRALSARGVACGENTVAAPMRTQGVRAKARRPFVVATTDGRRERPVAKDALNREPYPDRPDAVRTADITYVPTAEGGLYLAVVLDLSSRRVVGWATADHLRSELTCDALRMALTHRKPQGALPHHSDRGVQYTSEAYRDLLAGHAIEPSMSRTGNCWDKVVTEGFSGTAKRELTHHESHASREEARRSLFEYIEVFYNRQRLNSTLGYRSPAEYEVRFVS